MTSLRWATTGRLAGQLVTWLFTIIVIRILSPADYGTMAMASLVVGFFIIFEELGMSAAIIHKQGLSDDDVRKIFGLILCFAGSVYALIFLAAPFVADFFDVPELEAVIRVLALRIPISASGAVPSALIQKELRFKNKALVEFSATILASVATLVSAIAGLAVWALVIGSLSLAAAQMTGYWLTVRRLVLPSFDFRNIHQDFRFGSFVSADRFIWYLYSQADVFFVGKFLGNEVLGVYAVAMQLATLPMKKIASILNEVGFAAFSKIQKDLAEVRRNLMLAVRFLALVAFPVFFGIGAIADQIVDVFLGSKWAAVKTPLALLVMVVPLRIINGVTPGFLFALGQIEIAVGNSVLALVTLAPAFGIAAYFGGLIPVCLVWLLGYSVYYLIYVARSLPVIDVTLKDYLKPVLFYGLSGGVMYAVVRAMAVVLDGLPFPSAVDMVLLIAAGGATYLAIVWRLAPGDLRKLVTLLKS